MGLMTCLPRKEQSQTPQFLGSSKDYQLERFPLSGRRVNGSCATNARIGETLLAIKFFMGLGYKRDEIFEDLPIA